MTKSSDNAKLDTEDIMDYAPDNPLLHPAWIGCIHWVAGNAEAMAVFRADTGNQWNPGRTPLDHAIDETTGADKAFFIELAKWVNDYVW